MAPAEASLSIEVVFSQAPREVRSVQLTMPQGTTLGQAVVATGWADLPPLDKHVGIWGRRATLDAPLKDLDRVEIYRPLTVDPKEARRIRYRAHGEKVAKGHIRPQSGTKDMTQGPGPRD